MIFRLRDFVFYPMAIRSFRNFIEGSQYWQPDRRRSWVQEKLEKTLWHAVTNVPYYRRTLAPFKERFKDMVDRLDLRELPCLTKEAIKNHYRELCADNYEQYKTSSTHTSGSTGTPTQFLLDSQSNVSHFASIWRVLNWTGYRFGDRFADMTGYVIKDNKLFKYDWRLNCVHLSSFNFKKEYMPLYVGQLKKFKPVLIKAYPSALDLFCRWLHDIGTQGYRPKAVLTCAETLLDHQKAVIAEILQCPVYDFYNQNERAALISTCEHGRYHIHEEYSFVEILNAENPSETVAPIATTSFHNYAMPLIRYQTNDLATIDRDGLCQCKRTYKTVNKIIGRIEDIVITPDGRYVGRLDAAFKYSPGILMSQIIQKTTDEIRVRLVKASNFSQKDIDRIEQGLRERLGDVLKITYDFVESIQPARNGKVQFVISAVGKELLQGRIPEVN
jgi:phenylacetate-CoA ligase